MVVADGGRQEFRPQLLIDEEGRARKAECSCRFYRRNQLKRGPCEHMIALLMLHSRNQKDRDNDRNRATLRAETRTYSRRFPGGEKIYQLSLEHSRLKKRWGYQGRDLRRQQMVFNSESAAREAYFAEIGRLEEKGYTDTSS